VRGLENLDASTGRDDHQHRRPLRLSYPQLPAVVERLRHLRRLVQMDFWNYWAMKEADDKDSRLAV